MANAIRDAIEFIYGWKEKGVINRVISKTNELIKDNFEECIDNWMFDLRVTGEKLKTTQLYFKVQSYTSLRKLVESQIDLCKEKRTKIELKNTKNEFTARIGFLLGPATD